MTAAPVRAEPLRRSASIIRGCALPGTVFRPAAGIGGIAFYLLAVLGLALALRNPAEALRTWRTMPELCLAGLLLAGLNLASVLIFDLPARAFSWTPLLMMPLLGLLAAGGHLHPRGLYAGGALGAVLALGVALFDWMEHASPRPTGGLNAIVFAQVSLFCTMYALAGLLRHPGRLRSAGYLLGVCAGIAATVASGTRGALLGVPLLALLALRRATPAALSPTQRRTLIAAAAVVLLLVGALGHRLELWDRVTRIDDEVAAYQEGEVGTRAVALRLALWNAALALAAEPPLCVVGAHPVRAGVAHVEEQGLYPPDAVVYAHAHSLPLSILAEYGVIGLAVLALAGWLAWRGLGRAPPAFRRLGRVGLLVWLVLGMTNDIFAHQSTLRVLALGLAFCTAIRPDPPRAEPG